MSEYVKALFGNKSYFGNKIYEYKINEINIADNWNPTSKEDIGGFCYSTENEIARWLVKGDTLYDVKIPDNAEIIEIKNDSGKVLRTNKIILTNPQPITDEMALDLFQKSNLTEKAYFKVLAGYAVRGHINSARTIVKEKINVDNIDTALSEYQDFYKGEKTDTNYYDEILEDLKKIKENRDAVVNSINAEKSMNIDEFDTKNTEVSSCNEIEPLIIAGRYQLQNSFYSSASITAYNAFDLENMKKVKLFEISDRDLSKKTVSKIKLLIKLKENVNFPDIQKVFKFDNKLYVIEKEVNLKDTIRGYVATKTLTWLDVCDMLLPFIKTIKALRTIGFKSEFSFNDLFVDENNNLIIKNILIQELNAIEEISVEDDDIYQICSLMYFCLNNCFFEEEDIYLAINRLNNSTDKNSDLILQGLKVYPSIDYYDLHSFYNAISSEIKKTYCNSFFEINCFSMPFQKKLFKQERKANKIKKKRKKKELKKYRRKWWLLSTAITSVVLSMVCLISLKFVKPSIISSIIPLVSSTDLSESDIPLYTPTTTTRNKTSEKIYSVPDLVGKSIESVENSIKYENFDIMVIDEAYSEEYEKGDIISQTIEKKTMVAKSTPIGVVVSLGSNKQKIPDIKNKTVTDALYALSDSGFTLGQQIEQYDSFVPAGYVISTVGNIEEAPSGSLIGIIVSLGPDTTVQNNFAESTVSTTSSTTENITTTTTKKIVKSAIVLPKNDSSSTTPN